MWRRVSLNSFLFRSCGKILLILKAHFLYVNKCILVKGRGGVFLWNQKCWHSALANYQNLTQYSFSKSTFSVLFVRESFWNIYNNMLFWVKLSLSCGMDTQRTAKILSVPITAAFQKSAHNTSNCAEWTVQSVVHWENWTWWRHGYRSGFIWGWCRQKKRTLGTIKQLHH